jgi:hypothetical protein
MTAMLPYFNDHQNKNEGESVKDISKSIEALSWYVPLELSRWRASEKTANPSKRIGRSISGDGLMTGLRIRNRLLGGRSVLPAEK